MESGQGKLTAAVATTSKDAHKKTLSIPKNNNSAIEASQVNNMMVHSATTTTELYKNSAPIAKVPYLKPTPTATEVNKNPVPRP